MARVNCDPFENTWVIVNETHYENLFRLPDRV
jgi:hypothetical protein